MPLQQSCYCIDLPRSAYYRISITQDDGAKVVDMLNSPLNKHPCPDYYEYWKHLCKSNHHHRTHKLILQIEPKPEVSINKETTKQIKHQLLVPHQTNQMRSANSINDPLCTGSRSRIFDVINDFNLERLHIKIRTSFKGKRLPQGSKHATGRVVYLIH